MWIFGAASGMSTGIPLCRVSAHPGLLLVGGPFQYLLLAVVLRSSTDATVLLSITHWLGTSLVLVSLSAAKVKT